MENTGGLEKNNVYISFLVLQMLEKEGIV